MKVTNCTILSASDATSQTGGKVDSNQLMAASFHAYFGDSTAEGTVKIQASNDPCGAGNLPADFTPSHWVDIPSATASVTAGGAVLITINQMAYRWVRAVFTQSVAGNTTITVNMNALSV